MSPQPQLQRICAASDSTRCESPSAAKHKDTSIPTASSLSRIAHALETISRTERIASHLVVLKANSRIKPKHNA